MPNTTFLPGRNSISLAQLLGGDEERVLRVLHAFHGMANDGLLQLDGATRDGNGEEVMRIAQRLAMACHLVGEAETGCLLDAVGATGTSTAIDPVMTQHIARARASLIDSIACAAQRMEATHD